MYAAKSFYYLNHGVKTKGEMERVSHDNNKE